MRFSDSFLRALKDRASIAAYAERLVQWDRRKSQPGRGDYWAPCPFHAEKTASFHVRDQVGAYKCFGCGESGGILDLVMKLEGLNFPEAVERVAAFASVPLPADDERRDDAADKRRQRLMKTIAEAQALFVKALDAADGREARAYLDRRGLDAKARAQFGLGYAPGGYTWSIEKLRAAGAAMDEIAEAGLAYPGEDGRRPVDVFRNRVMFPICDPQGRVIAFGGRALEAEAKAKYLNSPDTPLFHKGRTLYRLKEARALLARTKAAGLVVGEGYMDVIAFERAGIAAVAALGTALTEDQLTLIWRAGGEPVFCFDGDAAGLRAASRAIDLALPQLGPERTFRVALMPTGQDPDDVFRAGGAKALAEIVAAAKPAIEALFERERDRAPLTTPEAKSGFRKRLRAAAARIADPETARLYREELMVRANQALAWAPQGRTGSRPPSRPGQRWTAPIAPTAELKPRAAPGQRRGSLEDLLRQAIDAPELIAGHAELFAALPVSEPDLKAIQNAALEIFIQSGTVDRLALNRHLSGLGETRAVARLSHWPQGLLREPPADASARGPRAMELEWVWAAEREAAAPGIKDEIEALRAQGDLDTDDEAFARAVKVLDDVRQAARRRAGGGDEDAA